MVRDLRNDITKFRNKYEKFKQLNEFKVTHYNLNNHKKITYVPINRQNKELALNYFSERVEDKELKQGGEFSERIRYSQTLYKELFLVTNVLFWFNDKDITKIDKEDIKSVYRKIERDELLTFAGKNLKPSSKNDFYKKVFKNGLFKYADKHRIAQDIIGVKMNEYPPVRFFREDILYQIIDKTNYPIHKLAFLLLFDTGIEVKALCNLQRLNFHIEKQDSGIVRIKLVVPKIIAKKGRQKRVMYINLEKTKELLLPHLNTLKPQDLLFEKTRPPALYKAIRQISRLHNFKTEGDVNEYITNKDFRSSCCVYILLKTKNKMMAQDRLGHSLSSKEIDRYWTWLALDKEPLVEVFEREEIDNNKEEINSLKNQVEIIIQQNQNLVEENKVLKEKVEYIDNYFEAFMPVLNLIGGMKDLLPQDKKIEVEKTLKRAKRDPKYAEEEVKKAVTQLKSAVDRDKRKAKVVKKIKEAIDNPDIAVEDMKKILNDLFNEK